MRRRGEDDLPSSTCFRDFTHIQISQCLARLGKFAAHAQALKEVDSLGEGGAGGGEIATQGVEADGEPWSIPTFCS